MKTELYAAIEALEEFQYKHYDWPYVRRETEAIKVQLESALSRFESLLEDMEKIEKEEALACPLALTGSPRGRPIRQTQK